MLGTLAEICLPDNIGPSSQEVRTSLSAPAADEVNVLVAFDCLVCQFAAAVLETPTL